MWPVCFQEMSSLTSKRSFRQVDHLRPTIGQNWFDLNALRSYSCTAVF